MIFGKTATIGKVLYEHCFIWGFILFQAVYSNEQNTKELNSYPV